MCLIKIVRDAALSIRTLLGYRCVTIASTHRLRAWKLPRTRTWSKFDSWGWNVLSSIKGTCVSNKMLLQKALDASSPAEKLAYSVYVRIVKTTLCTRKLIHSEFILGLQRHVRLEKEILPWSLLCPLKLYSKLPKLEFRSLSSPNKCIFDQTSL